MKKHYVRITLSLLVDCEVEDVEHIVAEMDINIKDTTGKGSIELDEIKDLEII